MCKNFNSYVRNLNNHLRKAHKLVYFDLNVTLFPLEIYKIDNEQVLELFRTIQWTLAIHINKRNN